MKQVVSLTAFAVIGPAIALSGQTTCLTEDTPEPGTIGLALDGLCALAVMRRRAAKSSLTHQERSL